MHHREAVERSLEDTSGTSATGPNYNKGNMKQFKIEVSHATPQQLSTIALELKIMSNGWEKFGPVALVPEVSSRDRSTASLWCIVLYRETSSE